MTELRLMAKLSRMDNSPEDLLYTGEVADILGVATRTVARMVADGRLKPAARGRGLRGSLVFRRSDVEKFAKSVAA